MNSLYWNTVDESLKKVLKQLMQTPEFNPFILVGGTALSLQLGHRVSVDIDLFTDADYQSIDFNNIDNYLKNHFNYYDATQLTQIGMGKSYFIGNSKQNAVKLDLYYTDKFIQKSLVIDNVRIAHIKDIIAMKLDVVQRGGRKKDFWDIHELINQYSLQEMLNLHKIRYPYTHDRELIVSNLLNCNLARNDFDPICLKNKIWDFIVLDIIDFVEAYQNE